MSFSSYTKENETVVSKSNTELLTSNTWVYNMYFINYNQGTTMLTYKRGNTNNVINLSLNKVKFNTDGTYQETTENGSTVNGTCRFLKGETQTEVKNSFGVFISVIVSLSETIYTWHDPSSARYGEMVPQ